MDKNRAQQILNLWEGYGFRCCSLEEDNEIMNLWYTMPGHKSWADALRLFITKDNGNPG